MLTVLQLNLTAFVGVLGDEVNNTGNGVRSILCCRAIAQNLYTFDRNAWNHADIHAVRTVTGSRSEKLDQCGTMSAFAVNQHQCLVRRCSTQ